MGAITTDILLTCADENRRGGIKRIFVVNKTDLTSFTAGGTDFDYTAVTLTTTAKVWYEVQVDDEGADFLGEGSVENGSSMIEKTITAKIPKLEKVKAKTLNDLFESCKVVAIIETYDDTGTNNQAIVVGYDEILGTDAALRANITETLEGELQGQNAYTLTLNGRGAQVAREFVGSIDTNASGSVSFGT